MKMRGDWEGGRGCRRRRWWGKRREGGIGLIEYARGWVDIRLKCRRCRREKVGAELMPRRSFSARFG